MKFKFSVLFFIQSVNVYLGFPKDYFKGHKRLHTIAQGKNFTRVKKCDRKPSFAPVLDEITVFVHHRIFLLSNFMI